RRPAPRPTRAVFTTATGQQMEAPPEVLRALRSSDGSGPVEIAQPDGSRMTIQLPGAGGAPATPPIGSLNPADVGAGASSPGSDGSGLSADGPVLYRRTTADRFATLTGGTVPPPSTAIPAPGAEADGLPAVEMDDEIAAAALKAMDPKPGSAGRVRQMVMVPTLGGAPPAPGGFTFPPSPLPELEPLPVEDRPSLPSSDHDATPLPELERLLPDDRPAVPSAERGGIEPAASTAVETAGAFASGGALGAVEPAPSREAVSATTETPSSAFVEAGGGSQLGEAVGAIEASGATSPAASPADTAAPPPPAREAARAPRDGRDAEPSAAAVPPAVPRAIPQPPPAADPETESGRDGGMGTEDPGAQTSMDRSDAANAEFRSEEIDEILTSMPGGLLRWGITAVFGTLAVLLAIAWFIRYPDVVQGKVSLTTLTPPVRVVSRSAGEVARVFAADRSLVRAGDPLLLLKNPADYHDVAALSAALDRLEPALLHDGQVPDVAFDHPLVLGDLQAPYSSFLQTYSDYRRVQADPYYGQKLAALREQIASHEQLRQRLTGQQQLLDEQLVLAERARTRARQLAGQYLSSSAEVDKAEQEYLAQRFATENGRTALTNNEIQLAVQRSALLDMEGRRSDDGQKLLVELRNAHHSLRAAISRWEQDFLLRSPVSGTVSLFRDLHENLFVGASEPLVAVVPSGGALLGRVTLSGMGAGKVRAGQRVIIHFDSYPYKEYGTVEGRVRSISQLGFEEPAGQGKEFAYQAEVSLPRGLVTSYNRKLEFRQEMRGDVQVVTEDLRLLERVFNQIRSLREVN
ncbi:MAG: hypothetical protein JWM27_2222, partial [Gemmatimonadetes bacterium]|nr:hypothetical protein [Gemmatimonadota bacterium]